MSTDERRVTHPAPTGSLRERARMRPALYPLGLLVAFLLYVLVQWQVSPWSIGRPFLVAAALGLGLPWLFGLVTGDRDRAALLAAIVVLLVLAGGQPVAIVFLVALFITVLVAARTALGRRLRWAFISRAMTVLTAIILVAVGITAVQNGMIVRAPRDVLAESPLGRLAAGARAANSESPSVYLILLDGYPRADKLATEFGIESAAFLDDLRGRGFEVAEQSRSNFLATDQTLASMLGAWDPTRDPADVATLRTFINDGSILHRFRDLGYEVIATSTAIEGVALREADRFVDTGQVNESEWNILWRGGLNPLLDLAAPMWLADQHRDRLFETLRAAESIVAEPRVRPRLALLHVMSPHSPLVVTAGGAAIDSRQWTSVDDSDEYRILGHDTYAQRLEGQLTYMNGRTLGLVDAISAADPRAVVVVFSDHGSGIREAEGDSDADLRSANLLAVRDPGGADLIDARSTLVNLLPRILRVIGADAPDDVPETIWRRAADGEFVEFERPD